MFGDKATRQRKRKEHRDEAAAARDAHKGAVREHREKQFNQAAMMRLWPSATMGQTSFGPVKGASAELFNAGAHKSWTATRLVACSADRDQQ